MRNHKKVVPAPKIGNQGFIYVLALALLVIFSTMGLAYMSISRSGMRLGEDDLKALQAFYDAESGAEHSYAEIKTGLDVNGDGLGNIPWTDLDGDSVNDYMATFDSTTNTLTASGSKENASRNVVLKLGRKNFTGALQSGGGIFSSFMYSGNVINGNVDAKGSINLAGFTTVNGKITPNNNSLVIPTPDTAMSGCYYNKRDQYLSGTPVRWNSNPSYSGIIYVNGDLELAMVSDYTLNGTLVVTGNVTVNMGASNTLHIIPSGKNPAIVAQGGITFMTAGNVILDGLVYSGGTVQKSSGGPRLKVNGAILAATQINIQSPYNSTINFNPGMDPPCFNNTGSLEQKQWKGHSN